MIDKKPNFKKLRDLLKISALSSIIVTSGQANAVSLGMAQTPLFLGSTVQPNVFFVLDDSGSMDWEFMMQPYWPFRVYDGDQDRDGVYANNDDTSNLETGGNMVSAYGGTHHRTYRYYYAEGDNIYSDGCTDWAAAMESCNGRTPSIFSIDWRMRTVDLNGLFYSPNLDFKPWSGNCDTNTPCADASFTAARSNPRNGEAGYGLTRNLATDGDANNGPFIYEVWIDDAGYQGTRPHRDADLNYVGVADANGLPAPNGMVDLWDSHIRFTVDATTVQVDRITYNPQPSNASNPGLNEAVQNLGTLSGSSCYDILGTTADVLAIHAQGATPNISVTGGANCRTIAELQTNIANWYQYSRRRSFPVKGAVSSVIDAQSTFRYGITVINDFDRLFIEVPDVSVTNNGPHNENVKDSLYQFDWHGHGTPLRTALQDAGKYYSNTLPRAARDPIVYSCQKNFTILFTDGYWNGGDPGSVGDADGDGVGIPTLADVAYKYYISDLNTTMENNVLIDAMETDLPTYNPPQGDRTHQHMVTFTVAFGVNGNMVDGDGDGDGNPDTDAAGGAWSTPGIPDKNGNWGTPCDGCTSTNIDDMWHAAYNSAGTFASASTPDEVTRQLIAAITNIAGRISSAAAVALNSGTLNANSRVYQASFDSNDWSGSLKSVPIQDGPVDELPLGNPDGVDDSPPECSAYPAVGQLCDQEWDAAEKLAQRTPLSRKIYTFNTDTAAGVEFKTLANLAAAQQTSMKTNPDTAVVEADAVGQLRIDYIRGDNSNEGTGSTEFRKRKVLSSGTSKLGDIIHSAPAFVANPTFFIPDNLEASSYNAYKNAKKNRIGVVYVGANDGMLHAFDASNTSNKGEELFAYIPGRLVNKLPQLTSKSYNRSHTYFVDGSPIVFDAYKGGWKTLLAGTAGPGGQVVFGLDITSPDTFSAADVLWEFTDDPRLSGTTAYGDKDLGYTLGEASYARMNNGQWVVIFGNGFNNTEADGNASTTGNAVVYVVDAFTGELISKLDTQTGMAEDPSTQGHPNGIARVTPIDINGDFKVDYIYAGDLFGNVWKMDVTSSSPSSWGFSYMSGTKPKPFFIAKDPSGTVQPITTAVSVKRHPEKVDQTLVLFGTGSYFQINDATTTQTQTFYGIWDDNTGAQYSRSKLLEQKILSVENKIGVDGINREFRVTSSADLNPSTYRIDWTTDKGWFMDLGFAPDVGERVNVEPILRGNRIIFVTLTPDADPCKSGGSSWIMELNANDGSRLPQSPFDVNGDGIIDALDIVAFGGDNNTIVSGVRSKEGIVAKPGILNTQNKKELKFFSGTTGNIETVTESINENMRDRQSWRQLR